MALMEKRDEYALKVTDQLHIHFPPSAFTNEATNFWVGAVMGVGLMIVLLAAAANR